MVSSIVIVLGYAASSSTLSIVNKWALVAGLGADRLQALQFGFSALIAVIVGVLSLAPVNGFEVRKAVAFLPAVVLFYASCFSNIKLLQHVNVDTFVVIRSLTPLTTLLFELVGASSGGSASCACSSGTWHPQLARVASLLSLCVGAAGFGSTLESGQITRDSILWGSFYLMVTSLNFAAVKRIVHDSNLSPWGLVLYNNSLALLLQGAYTVLVSPFFLGGAHVHPLDELRNAHTLFSRTSITPLLVSCVLGVVISWFGFQARMALSPTSFAVVGVVCKVVTVFINQTVWDLATTGLRANLCLAMVILGGYSYQRATSTLQTLVSSSQATITESNSRVCKVIVLTVVCLGGWHVWGGAGHVEGQSSQIASPSDGLRMQQPSTWQRRRSGSSTTIFTCPKGIGHRGTSDNEALALMSWVRMQPPPDYIVLVGTPGSGVDGIARKLNADPSVSTRVVHVALGDDGFAAGCVGEPAPSVSAIFNLAEASVPVGAADLFAYVNSDIILPTAFLRTARSIRRNTVNSALAANQSLAIVGRGLGDGSQGRRRVLRGGAVRSEQDVRGQVVITGMRTDCKAHADRGGSATSSQLLAHNVTSLTAVQEAIGSCTPHAPTGKDYWVYTRGFWDQPEVGGVPAFAIGRSIWDNYLTKMANVRGLAVDASAVIEAVHLDHDYTHTQTGTHASAFHGAASLYNKALAMTSYARVKVDDSWTSFSYHSDIQHLELQACPATCRRGGTDVRVRVKEMGAYPKLTRIANRTLASEGRCPFARHFGCRSGERSWPW